MRGPRALLAVSLGLVLALSGPALAAPFALGAGHAIAGDPRRGLFVGTGGLAALGLGLGIGWLLSSNRPPASGPYAPPDLSILAYSLGIALSMTPYWFWAGWDAGTTAQRLNPFPAPEPETRPGATSVP